MGYRTAREFLAEYQRADATIRGIQRQLDTFWDAYQSPRFDSSGGGSNAPKRPIDDLVDKREELREKLALALEEQTEIQMNINRVILLVPGATERRVLFERYLDGKRWDAIADSIGYERRQIMRYHERALEQVQEILDDAAGCHTMSH